jgi:hypothetical protein
MRVGVCAAAVFCAVVVAGTARAQAPANQFVTALGGPSPSALQFKPIDMKNLVVAPPNPSQSGFSMASMFRRLPFTGRTSQFGVSNLPAPSSFPTYPNGKMVGTPPYQLGDPKASKFPYIPFLSKLNN